MTAQRPIPLRPDPDLVRDRAVASLTRATIAASLHALDRSRSISDLVRKWDDHRTVDLILRAATTPAMTTTTGWARELGIISAAFLDVLTVQSAGADLMKRGIGLNFDGAAQIACPGISIPAADFVGEGSPIPAVQGVTSAGPTLLPHKIGVITSLTGEMVRSSSAEDLVRQVLIESTGPAVDKAMFSATAGDAIRPAGILNGIAALTAAAAGPSKGELLVNDVQALATALGPVSGNGGIVLVASPDAAAALVLRLPAAVQWPVLTSGSLAARTVIAVAANAIVSAVEGVPQIDTSTQASFHRETAPGAIVDVGGVAARPVGSLWQVDEVGLKLTWHISWSVRDPRGVAWMQGVNW